jgi:hypothetical protein
MPEYKNILVEQKCRKKFDRDVAVYLVNPIELVGEAQLRMEGRDLYADLIIDFEADEFYPDVSSWYNEIDCLFLIRSNKDPGIKKIKDQVEGKPKEGEPM